MTDSVHEYHGPGFTIRFDARRCLHAGACVRGLPGVFDTRRRPWIDATAAPLPEIAAVVGRCPTGALSLQPAPAEHATAQARLTLRVTRDGPLYLEGPHVIVAAGDAAVGQGARAALCRCGHSANAPYCDGAHQRVGFAAPAAVPALPPDAGPPRPESPARVELRPDGPLHLSGDLTLTGDDATQRGGELWLCRCGQSACKPYCDGAHKRSGFRAP